MHVNSLCDCFIIASQKKFPPCIPFVSKFHQLIQTQRQIITNIGSSSDDYSLSWSLTPVKMCFLFVAHFIICVDKRFVDVTIAALFIKTNNWLLPVQECQSLTLHSFLMLPMQRITRCAPFNFYTFCVPFANGFLITLWSYSQWGSVTVHKQGKHKTSMSWMHHSFFKKKNFL